MLLQDSLHLKKTLETMLLASGITFLGNSTNKTKLVKFLASQLRKQS